MSEDALPSERPSKGVLRRSATVAVVAATVLVLADLVVRRARWLGQFERQYNVTDAYFYLHEFRAWLSGAGGYYEKRSVFFALTSALGRIFGATEGALYVAIAIASLVALSLAVAIAAGRTSLWWLVPVVMLLPWASDILFVRHFAFLRQFFSLDVFLLGCAIASRRSRRWLPVAIALCVLGTVTHHVTAALATVSAVVWMLFRLTRPGARIGAVALGALALAALIEAHPYVRSAAIEPGAWHIGPINACAVAACSPFESFELAVVGAVVIAIALHQILFSAARSPLVAGACVAFVGLNLPFWKQDGDLAYRLAIASVPIGYFALALFLRTARLREMAVASAVAAALALGGRALDRTSYDLPRAEIAAIGRSAPALRGWLPPGAFVTAPHGVEFAITYYTGHASARSLPKKAPDDVFALVIAPSFAPQGCADTAGPVPRDVPCIRLEDDVFLIRRQ